MDSIGELDQLSAIDAISAEYESAFGSPPFNLSHWDPSEHVMRAVLPHLDLPVTGIVAPYLYAYDLDLRECVLDRLGVPDPKRRRALIVPTGTSSIMFAVWWLRSRGVEHVLVLCPSYFPVFYACDMVGLAHSRVYLDRVHGTWELPRAGITRAMHASATALWVTNPVYCTGVSLGESDAQFINTFLAEGGIVVLDECLALSGQELGRQLSPTPGLLGLYSPHKGISLNAVKFGAIVFDASFERFFTDWTDILVGGLGASNYNALLHFLGENFLRVQRAFMERIRSAREQVCQLVASRYLDVDPLAEGYFMTCYAPSAPHDCAFLRDLVFRTGAIMIPGSRNHFSPDLGFNFRINLARDCPQFLAALVRTLDYLAK